MTSLTNKNPMMLQLCEPADPGKQSVCGKSWVWTYDASGVPFALKYNGTLYYYITNLQGDVTQLVNASGSVVASYEYDPYGNIAASSGSMAETNPLRYRGYCYDSETEFYYLQSRYYDPQIGRFINADALVSTGQSILGNNMFAYCNNNPVNCADSSGALTDAQIHDAVLEEISKRNGGRYRYKRSDTKIIYDVLWGLKWYGYCDLYDPSTGETWELKKNTSSWSCTTTNAKVQLLNYINNGYLESNPELDLKLPETSIPSGYFTLMDSNGDRYIVNYWDEGGGILRYNYRRIPSNRQVAAMTVIAGAFVASVVYQSAGGSNRAIATIYKD